MKITWKLDGRSVSRDQAVRGLIKKAQDQALKLGTDKIHLAVGSVRCPEHHQAPRPNGPERSGDAVRVRFEFCCPRLEALAKEAIERAQ